MDVLRWVRGLFGRGREGDAPIEGGRSEPPQSEPVRIEVSAEPDLPVPFGFKTNWFAIRADSCEAVAEALGLQDVEPANWASGVEAANGQDDQRRIFISPRLSGWILAVGSSLPYPIDYSEHRARIEIGERFDALFRALVDRFPEVAFFATHRVADFNSWALARGGVIERVFGYADGEVMANRGAQTEEERALKILDLGDRAPEEASEYMWECCEAQDAEIDALVAAGVDHGDAREQVAQTRGEPMVDEDHTLALAGAWSLDPTTLDECEAARGVGLIGVLPANLSV